MLKRIFFKLLIAFFCYGMGGLSEAAVTKAVLAANPAKFQGDCPGLIRFKGSITSNTPGVVTYIFTRSDGATDTNIKKIVFKRRGTKKVEDTWTLGGSALPYYTGWEKIKILTPRIKLSNEASFELRCNPPLNSALAAHGNTDWHIDTANEFLFGKDMAGNTTAPNHAPNSWTKTHIHQGLTNTSKYYYDKTLNAAGDDTNASSGIDRAMLFFYAGHGWPLSWDTLGDSASQNFMNLGNITQGGTLRYYWQCSCEVFAHGPKKTCGGSSFEYSCPQDFTGGPDTEDMRNVFLRWGPALNRDLRMACGMTTSAYCHEGNVNKVWDNYNNKGMSVADSFIEGFGDWGVVPLCITLGGTNITTTPLYDTVFSNQPNTSGNSSYHIMYASQTGSATKPLSAAMIPKKLPKIKLAPAEITSRLRGISDLKSVSVAPFAGGKAKLHIEPASGAVYLSAEKHILADKPVKAESEYLANAKNLIRELDWDDRQLGQPIITRLMTASMPVGGKVEDIKEGQKGVVVKYKRQIEVNGKWIDVIGNGGLIEITMSNDGSVTRASRVWRKIANIGQEVDIKNFDEALKEANGRLGKPDNYRLDQWRWGYKEPAGNEQAEELKITYQFAFVPINSKDLRQFPPRIVEIEGEKK